MATASAAVKPTKKVELQLALNINFKFTGKLIPVMSSFNVLSQLLNWKVMFLKRRDDKFEVEMACHCMWMCIRSPANQMISVWLVAGLGVIVLVQLYSS